jgi:hypothetical protein
LKVTLCGKIRTAMSHLANTVSFGTTGIKNFNVGSNVLWYRISLCGVPGSTESFSHRSIGIANQTLQNCQTEIVGRSNTFTDRVIHHYNLSGGSIVDAVVASHASFNAGTGFSVNVTTTAAYWQWLVEYETV